MVKHDRDLKIKSRTLKNCPVVISRFYIKHDNNVYIYQKEFQVEHLSEVKEAFFVREYTFGK